MEKKKEKPLMKKKLFNVFYFLENNKMKIIMKKRKHLWRDMKTVGIRMLFLLREDNYMTLSLNSSKDY